MATDTPDARMLPVASRYCYCVCDKKRRKHPGVRLQLFPKDARSAISISGDWARCGSRGGQLYHYYRKYGTQWERLQRGRCPTPSSQGHMFIVSIIYHLSVLCFTTITNPQLIPSQLLDISANHPYTFIEDTLPDVRSHGRLTWEGGSAWD
ncbi:hypothetical protein GWK47_040110 [Chionoecetes opilio]|uniref:Uncharacterized protein n=1 Tax=Chionoecetes opilio TaxID=41210 RepID=A0A8J5D021_CHIOP|nr:hypothetical protein GWK47_040110 [Chionoecetes opilio]